ncbi:hypothetical protein [Dietzia sp. KRD202]|uniref:hypothetical protein n=1 Tax=Dietzia sp. KRD202 TaxID=2729732 RepID=UPI0019D092F4|nr:hypothetical protein [Dietzia sp. KRD202]
MSTKITAENAATIEVGQLGITVVHPEGIASIWARLTAEQRTKLAAALAPERTPILEGGPVHGITVTGYVGDAPIDPVDCDRTTVYTGECRNFADTEWIRFDSGRRRSPDARDGNTWLIDVAYGSFWMADDKVRNLVPLVPAPTGGPWTRDDLPEMRWLHQTFLDGPSAGVEAGFEDLAVALVDHLNAHHPKSGMEARLDAEAAGAEMTAAYAARDAAERRCDELRSLIEGQKEHVSKSIEVRNRMRRERDEAVARATLAEQECENWRVTAINRAAPAVTRVDVEKAIRSRPILQRWIDSSELVEVGDAVDAACEAIRVEAEQDVDPVEERVDALADAVYGDELVSEQMRGVLERLVRSGWILPEGVECK